MILFEKANPGTLDAKTQESERPKLSSKENPKNMDRFPCFGMFTAKKQSSLKRYERP